MLKAGADPNAQERRYGRAPLHEAAREGERETVEVLLRHDARVDVRDKEGKTPLDEAARMGKWDVVARLAHAAEQQGAARPGPPVVGSQVA